MNQVRPQQSYTCMADTYRANRNKMFQVLKQKSQNSLGEKIIWFIFLHVVLIW